jgi:hypothetical protein
MRFHLLRRDSKRQGCRFIFHNCIQLLKNILHDLAGQRKVRCHIIIFVKLIIHMFELVWTQSSFVSRLYFLMDEIVCISLIEMNVILVVVDIQNIHENKSMTWNFQKLLAIVDDFSNHKWLIIWSIHMNTHIVPLYVVSFKLNMKWHNKFLHLYMDISWRN